MLKLTVKPDSNDWSVTRRYVITLRTHCKVQDHYSTHARTHAHAYCAYAYRKNKYERNRGSPRIYFGREGEKHGGRGMLPQTRAVISRLPSAKKPLNHAGTRETIWRIRKATDVTYNVETARTLGVLPSGFCYNVSLNRIVYRRYARIWSIPEWWRQLPPVVTTMLRATSKQ